MSARKAVSDALKQAAADGWNIRKTRGNHFKLEHAEATQAVIVASTPSDHRALLNFKAQLKRALPEVDEPQDKLAALPVQRGKPNRPQRPAAPQFVMPSDRPFITKQRRFDHVFVEVGASATDNRSTTLKAWRVAILRLRAGGSGWDTVAIIKRRVRTDQAFLDQMVEGYRQTPPETIAELNAALRSGKQPNHKRLEGWLSNWRSKPQPVIPVIPEPSPVPVQAAQAPEHVTALLNAATVRAEQAEARLAELEANLVSERQKRLYAERARDDAHGTLAEEREELKALRKQIAVHLKAAQAATSKPKDIPAPAPVPPIVIADLEPPIVEEPKGIPAHKKDLVRKIREAVAAKATEVVAAKATKPKGGYTHGIRKDAASKPKDIPAQSYKPDHRVPVESLKGLTLAKQRRAVGLSQSQLAKALGVSAGLVGQWECGIATPPPARQAAIAAIFNDADFVTKPAVQVQPTPFDKANLVKQRKAAGLTQAQLAERVGISMQLIGHYETGSAIPPQARVAQIQAALAAAPAGPKPKYDGKGLRERRLAIGLSQRKFGQLIGVHTTSVKRWENGREQPYASSIAKIEAAFISYEPATPPAPRPAPPAPPPAPVAAAPVGIEINGAWFITKRKQLGISQTKLGQLLGVTGQLVSLWENDLAVPPAHRMAKIFQVLAGASKAEKPPQTLGGWIRTRRHKLGLSQQKLGELVGVHGSQISLWERDFGTVMKGWQPKLARALRARKLPATDDFT